MRPQPIRWIDLDVCAFTVNKPVILQATQQGLARYLVPGSVGEHASKEGIHVASIHGLAVLLDALCISKDQALPEQRIALPELICDLPVGGKTLRYAERE